MNCNQKYNVCSLLPVISYLLSLLFKHILSKPYCPYFSVLFVYVFFYQVVLYSDNDNGTLFPYT